MNNALLPLSVVCTNRGSTESVKGPDVPGAYKKEEVQSVSASAISCVTCAERHVAANLQNFCKPKLNYCIWRCLLARIKKCVWMV